MRKYLAALGAMALMVALSLLATEQRVRAGITCTLPNTLQNGTVADATQVMANFNAITACFLNNIAASGANNDITGLFALTTPLAPVNGGTPIYIGANSGGGANAQTIATTVPSNFTLTAGRSVLFVAGLTNTGPATLNVVSSGAVALTRRTSSGVVALSGGEIVANNTYIATYDGTQWQVTTQSLPKAPTTQRFITSNGTYTTPAGVTWIELWLVGGGGGGSGNATGGGAGGDTCWNTSGAACTGPVYDAGGASGGGTPGGAGGVVSGTSTCNDAVNGGSGVPGEAATSGGQGGYSTRGGAGAKNASGSGESAVANSGSGGQGAGTTGGGGAGATCYAIISNPAATYTYVVGAAGAAGTGANAGGTGGAGNIVVVEHYGS